MICPTCKRSEAETEFYPNTRVGLRCKECAIAYGSKWYAANKDRKRVYDEKRRRENRHLYRAANSRWQKSSSDVKAAATATRRARMKQQTPPWSSRKAVQAFYSSAARVTKCLGIKHDVDHFIPLQGELVSGLHAPANLRVYPKLLNILKHNHVSTSP